MRREGAQGLNSERTALFGPMGLNKAVEPGIDSHMGMLGHSK